MNISLTRQDIISFYSNENIARLLVDNAKSREVAFAFMSGSYDKRPNILQFPSDVVQMAKRGVTSFHYSVEHWENPMMLSSQEKNYSLLRKGFDVIIDIDSKLGMEESKSAANLICNLFEKYGIRNYGIKFSGRRGFHICLPWTALPKEIDYKKTGKMYPKLPKILARFVRKKIKDSLMKELITLRGAKQLIDAMDELPSELNPFYFVEVEKDWGERHMFRAPLSLNEKTWLVSIPLKSNQLKGFSAEMATISKAVDALDKMPEFFIGEKNEAESLVQDAVDWYASVKKDKPKTEKKIVTWEKRISEDIFPPCAKLILSGMSDGKKRSLFTLINFLKMMNWQWPEIEERVFLWNENNKPPLPKNYIIAQLRYQQSKDNVPPSNCDSSMYYSDIGICRPDETCKSGTGSITIKNPVSYPFRKMKPRNSNKSSETKKVVERGYACGICKEEFKNMKGLAMHKSRTHGVSE